MGNRTARTTTRPSPSRANTDDSIMHGTTFRVAEGVDAPVLAFGTYGVADGEGGVNAAWEAGVRSFDCAPFYGNEAAVGRALAKLPRSEIFVTSKLWNDCHHPDRVRAACERSLSDLGLDHLDLYLIHWPVAWAPGGGKRADPGVGLLDTWRSMEGLVDAGLVRAIGVSNFGSEHLAEVLAGCRIRPAVNQIELHPCCAQRALVGTCRRLGVTPVAYRPLAAGKLPPLWGSAAVARASERSGRSPAEVLLRWSLQRGVPCVVRSGSGAHLAANVSAATDEWELSEEDMLALSSMDGGLLRTADPVKWGWEGFSWGGAAEVAGQGGGEELGLLPEPGRAEREAARMAIAAAREAAERHASAHRAAAAADAAAAPPNAASRGGSGGEAEDDAPPGWALVVAKRDAKGWKDRAKAEGWLDPSRRAGVGDTEVALPLVDGSEAEARAACEEAAGGGAGVERRALAVDGRGATRGGWGRGGGGAADAAVWAAVSDVLESKGAASGGGEGGGKLAGRKLGGDLGLAGCSRVGDACVLPAGALRRVPWQALGDGAARVKRAAAAALGGARLLMPSRSGGLDPVYGGSGWVEWEEAGLSYSMDLASCPTALAMRPWSPGWAKERARLAALPPASTVAVLGAGVGEWVLPHILPRVESSPADPAGWVHAFEADPGQLEVLDEALGEESPFCELHARDGWDASAVAAAEGCAGACDRVVVPAPLGGPRAAAGGAGGGGGWAAAAAAALSPAPGAAVEVHMAGVPDGAEASRGARAAEALARALSAAGVAASARLGRWWRVPGDPAGGPGAPQPTDTLLVVEITTCTPAPPSPPPAPSLSPSSKAAAPGGAGPPPRPKEVPRVEVTSPVDFSRVLEAGEPVVMTGIPMGDAVGLWRQPEYLARRVAEDRMVPVHVAPGQVVDLAGHRCPNTPRNFKFCEVPFPELMRRMQGGGKGERGLVPILAEGERYYMRSVNSGKGPTHFPALFPELAEDLPLPTGLWREEDYHSSVLRVASGGTTLWTHFDTHDNLLMEVVGRKKVVLWPPWSEPYLYCEGSSSRVDDIDAPDATERFPLFARAIPERRECELGPGEALFLPALWFHHVSSLEFTAAVNVFWRGLDKGAYNPRDWYGNKDPLAAAEAAEAAGRAGRALAALPEPYRSFYGRRAVRALEGMLGLSHGS